MSRVLVLGGGFGGLAAAHRLRERLPANDEVVVIDRRERFFPGLAKLWDLAGIKPLEDSSMPLAGLARHGIDHLPATITSIDPEQRSVETSAGTQQGDALLIALGAAYNPTHLEMLGSHGHNLYDGAALPDMRGALGDLRAGRIAIVIMGLPYKCPPAPYEAALLVDERLRREGRRGEIEIAVHTPQPSPLPVAGPDASAAIAAVLEERDVELHRENVIVDVDDDAIRFQDEVTTPYSLLLGVPQHVAPEVLSACGLTGPSGWVEPERDTMRTAHDLVYAVGDCTHLPLSTGALPKAGVFAEKEGVVAADNIAAELGHGAPAKMDGEGFCFLEFGGRTAAYVRGDFFAEPKPDVKISEPDEETFRNKERFVTERLATWL